MPLANKLLILRPAHSTNAGPVNAMSSPGGAATAMAPILQDSEVSPINVAYASSVQTATAHRITITGDLDANVIPRLQEEISYLASQGDGELVVDLVGVEHVDAAGMQVLVTACKRFRKTGRDFILAGVPAPVQRVLDLTGLTSLFHIR